MTRLPNPQRVRIWNSLTHLAWSQKELLCRISIPASGLRRPFRPKGGLLTTEQETVIALLTFCTLAIEARANHLIDTLLEDEKISEAEADAAQRLAPDQKWFLIPRLAKRRRILHGNIAPHQAIKEICACRNALVHVNYARLSSQLPSTSKMLSLFRGFVEAVEDMNVVLGRSRKVRSTVLARGRC